MSLVAEKKAAAILRAMRRHSGVKTADQLASYASTEDLPITRYDIYRFMPAIVATSPDVYAGNVATTNRYDGYRVTDAITESDEYAEMSRMYGCVTRMVRSATVYTAPSGNTRAQKRFGKAIENQLDALRYTVDERLEKVRGH